MNKFFLISFITLLSSDLLAANTNGYKQTLTLQRITFDVTSKSSGSLGKLQIIPKGLKAKTAPIVREIDGTVTGAEIADLNADGSPEIYIYVNSAGSGSYGSVIAYAVNKKHSVTEIYMPNLLDDPNLSKGYMGHDEFSILENRLGRRFPLYLPGDINSKPSGGIRQLEYKLVPGEAGWLLKVSKQTDFR
jgi:hypothetical protein